MIVWNGVRVGETSGAREQMSIDINRLYMVKSEGQIERERENEKK